MITAKEIREVKFNRSMGGYKTTEVDEFLDRCADAVDEYTRMIKETERKMQVLAESVMDYRNQEDGIRSALISAQRMGESVITDARKQADDIREAARSEAATMHERALADISSEREELRRVKQEVADFKSKLLAVYREHLTLIGILENNNAASHAAAPAHAADEPEKVETPPVAAPAPIAAPAPAPVPTPAPAPVAVPAPAPVAVPMPAEAPIGRPIPYAMPDFTSFELIDN